jgi:hypothetical protein
LILHGVLNKCLNFWGFAYTDYALSPASCKG